MKIEQFISKRIHKLNALRFWIKVWWLTNLYGCSESYVDIPNIPLITQHWYQNRWFDEGFYRLLVLKVFLTKVIRWRVPLSAAATAVHVQGLWKNVVGCSKSHTLQCHKTTNSSCLSALCTFVKYFVLNSVEIAIQ
jgi:hypothetical protein